MSQNFSRSLHETIGNRFRGKERIKGEIVGEWSASWNFERRFPLNRNPMETSLRRLGRNSTSTKGRTPLRRYDPPQNASEKENPSSPVSKVNGVEVKELARIHSGQHGSPPFFQLVLITMDLPLFPSNIFLSLDLIHFVLFNDVITSDFFLFYI